MFEYRRIQNKQIRLFQVVATDPRLEILLDSFPVVDCPCYIAISYAWGNTANTLECGCNGDLFDIGRSLYEALCNVDIFNPDGTWYWADAICINQGDGPEKASQVSNMSDVYKNAAETAVWLGLSEQDSDLALTQMQLMTTTILSHKELWGGPLTAEEFSKVDIPALDDPVWVAILHVFGRPWFSRLWIVQEAVLSENIYVHCGAKNMNWHSLVACAWVLARQSVLFAEIQTESLQTGVLFIHQLDQIRRRKTWLATGWGILFLLLQSQNASEKLDYVYGVHALLPDHMQEKLKVDYSTESKAAYNKLHAEFFVLVLREMGAIPNMCFMTPVGHRNATLPSWCPDWATKTSDWMSGLIGGASSAGRAPMQGHALSTSSPAGGSEALSKLSLDSSRGDTPRHETEEYATPLLQSSQAQSICTPSFKVELSAESRILTIAGACFDVIDEVLRLEPGTDTDLPIPYACECIKQVLRFTARDPGVHTRVPGILLGDHNWRRSGGFIGYKGDDILVDLLQALTAWIARNEEDPGSADSDDDPPQLLFFFARVFGDKPLRGRALARTRQGRFGSVPKTTEPGDFACLFFNANLPYVLTPLDADGHQEIKGPAFVDGVMKGELFLPAQEPRLEHQDFHLI